MEQPKKVVSLDLLEFFILNPFAFQSLQVKERREITSKRPTPNIDTVQYDHGKVVTFNAEWYNTYKWLTGSRQRGKLYCFYCLIAGDTSASDRLSLFKDFHKSAREHQISRQHILSTELYIKLTSNSSSSTSPGDDSLTLSHRDSVRMKRTALKRIIQSVFIFKMNILQETMPARESLYKESIDFIVENELIFSSGWDRFFPDLASPEGQYAIFNTLREYLKASLKQEMLNADFISVQLDDVSEYTCKAYTSVIFRYVTGNEIRERFGGFYCLREDATCEIYNDSIRELFRQWEIEDKVLSISCDFSIDSLDFKTANRRMERNYHIIHTHSVHYKMNLIMLKSVLSVPEVRTFVIQIAAIAMIFRDEKRIKFFEEIGFSLPGEFSEFTSLDCYILVIRWWFLELKKVIHTCPKIADLETLGLIAHARLILQDCTFVYLLCLFAKIFEIGDSLTGLMGLLSVNTSQYSMEVMQAIVALKTVQSKVEVARLHKESQELNPKNKSSYPVPFTKLTQKIVDIITQEVQTRYNNQIRLTICELFDRSKFTGYKDAFPSQVVEDFKLTQRIVDFDFDALKNELSVIYEDETKSLHPQELLKHLKTMGLENVYSQTTQLLTLFLTLPLTAIEADQEHRVYNRIKRFCHKADWAAFETNDFMVIEDQLVSKLMGDNDFIEEFIDYFAEACDRKELILSKEL